MPICCRAAGWAPPDIRGGLSETICWFDQGSMLSRAEVERAMRRFAEQVMPKVRAG